MLKFYALIYEIRSNVRIVFVKTASRIGLFRLIFRHYGRIWISFIYPEALMDSLKFWWRADYIYDTSDRQGYDSKITFPNAIAAGEK